MTFDEACELARLVEADPRLAVCAIGRFELVVDVIAHPADHYPWAVSVVSRSDASFCRVLRSREALDDFVLLASRADDLRAARAAHAAATPKPTAPPHKPAAEPKPPAAPAGQLTLF